MTVKKKITKKVRKSTPKDKSITNKTGSKKTMKEEDSTTPRDDVIIDAHLLFPRHYKKANALLLEQGIKISESRYYAIIKEKNEDAFNTLANRGKNYFPILADMGAKLDLFENLIKEESMKKNPNPIKINAWSTLIKIQPLRSVYDNQVRRLMEKTKKENEHLTV